MPSSKVILAGTALFCAAALAAVQRAPAAPARPAPSNGEALAKRHCVTCHAASRPDVLPRASWRGTLEKMSLIVQGKGVASWGEPRPAAVLSEDYQAILAYYEAAAPEALPAPDTWPAPDERVRFVRKTVAFAGALTPEPAVANVRLADLEGDPRPELLACDMRQGLVLMARPYDPGAGAAPIAQVPHPDHVSVVDLDEDGRKDLLVADLGEFFPGDHEKGAATWLRSMPGGGFSPFTLGGFPRVADVEAADVDGDGRLDLVVAAFGWNRKGGMELALYRGTGAAGPSFERRKLDPRPGAIHLLPGDVDKDGRLDLVGLIAQEHESVVAFLGDGKGGFQPRTIYAAPHPNWGSSGIQLVDLDRDGDLDVLATNGDMFDDDLLKPYHGIQWLENRGRLRFEARPLAGLAGAHRAVAADLDGDGDLDVAASAFTGIVAGKAAERLPALVWLEQRKPGRFERHTIAVGNPAYPTLDAGDVDGDGDVDLVTGLFRLQGISDHWLEVWENQSRAAPRP
jgi:mono/diheme cytochrome c family protein